jgi:hypothetical protein
MPLYLKSGKLLVRDNKLAAHADCCCCCLNGLTPAIELSGYSPGECSACSNLDNSYIFSLIDEAADCCYSDPMTIGSGYCFGSIASISIAINYAPANPSACYILVHLCLYHPFPLFYGLTDKFALTGTDAYDALTTACEDRNVSVGIPYIDTYHGNGCVPASCAGPGGGTSTNPECSVGTCTLTLS